MPQLEDVVLEVGPVWSSHPVHFALVTTERRQYVAYYDPEQWMTVAARDLDSEQWTHTRLSTQIGWDSHNHVAMAVDEEGYVHVSGNMHNVPLIYFRSARPHDISEFERLGMAGTHEQSVTYPEFFRGPEGQLVFAYRDGGSGNGDHIFNAYDVETRQWRRLLDQPLTDGEGQRNAYPVGPVQGPDDYWHLVWVWRDTPDAVTNHDLSYARTRDLVQWERADGQPLRLPIRLSTGDIVDPVPVRAGMINNNTKLGFDAQQRPVVAYHKYQSPGGPTQLYNARFEAGAWVVYQTSEWDYRWDFGGGGTLVFEIEVMGVQLQPDGRLTQTFYHAHYGGLGAFVLNPETLRAVERIDPPLPYPEQLDEVESSVAGMRVRWAEDWSGEAPSHRYLLRWETWDSNRDMPRESTAPPSTLRVYGFAPSH